MLNYEVDIDIRRATDSVAPASGSALADHKLQGVFSRVHIWNILTPVLPAFAVLVWLCPIRAPLWLDETVSYWQISDGISQIWARQGLSFPTYSYLLWATSKIIGRSEVALRAPSVIAMIAAAFVLYWIARECFDKEIAVLVVTVFCFHPLIVFAAIDVRPYAFAVLTVNCAILSLLRWTRERSNRYAAFFGAAAAGIFYFHYLFGVILVGLAACFLVMVRGDRRRLWKQLALAAAVFTTLMLPVIPRLAYLFHTAESHVFAGRPNLPTLILTLAPNFIMPLFILTLLIAVSWRRISEPESERLGTGAVCLALGVVPLLILYSVSMFSTLHVFVERYRLVAIPGIALCWGLLTSRIASSTLRALFCVAIAAIAGAAQFGETDHGYTWKYALEAVNESSSAEHSPVMICSDLPESDYIRMPEDVSSLNGGFFAPLSYYRIASPVIPLPRALNEDAKRQVNKFLAQPLAARRRFFVVGFVPSRPTLDWINQRTRDGYSSVPVGKYDDVSVVEYNLR